jgi:serine/threonine protein kinase
MELIIAIDSYKEMVQHEIDMNDMLSQYDHPNIVKFLGSTEDQFKISMYLEYFTETLSSLIAKHREGNHIQAFHSLT